MTKNGFGRTRVYFAEKAIAIKAGLQNLRFHVHQKICVKNVTTPNEQL